MSVTFCFCFQSSISNLDNSVYQVLGKNNEKETLILEHVTPGHVSTDTVPNVIFSVIVYMSERRAIPPPRNG